MTASLTFPTSPWAHPANLLVVLTFNIDTLESVLPGLSRPEITPWLNKSASLTKIVFLASLGMQNCCLPLPVLTVPGAPPASSVSPSETPGARQVVSRFSHPRNQPRGSIARRMNNPDREHQKQVNAYFGSTLGDWDTIYHESGVYQTIYQRRRTVALSLVDKLALPEGSRVLEVGCAHGLTTIALAERGFFVEAVDAVPEMISAARIRAHKSGLQRVSFQVADIQNLPFQASSFNLVLVIGVTEWLRSLEQPLRQIERVLTPGGYLVIAADNRYALVNMLDPLRNPVAIGPKRILQALLLRFGFRWPYPCVRNYSIRQFDSFLRSAGLRKAEGKTVGFGPFSFWHRPLLPENAGLKLDQSLQRLADTGLPLLRSRGYVYIVVAVK